MTSPTLDVPTRRSNPLLTGSLILFGLVLVAVLVAVTWMTVHRWSAGPPARPAGTTVTDGDLAFRVTLVDVNAVTQGPTGERMPDGKFVIVHVSVTNRGDLPEHVIAGNQILRVGDRTYTIDHDATVNAGDTLMTTLPGRKGAAGDLVLVYDVPESTRSAAIELHAVGGSDGAAVNLPAVH